MATPKLIQISTRKYSAFFKSLFEHYNSNVLVRIDAKVYENDEIDQLREWLSKTKILNTLNFELIRNGETIFAFHDHPGELWASYSELSFVKSLEEKNILKYRIQEEIDAGFIKGIYRFITSGIKKRRERRIFTLMEKANSQFRDKNYSAALKSYMTLGKYRTLDPEQERRVTYCRKSVAN